METTETPKKFSFLNTLKVKKGETFDVYLAVDSTNPDMPLFRYAVTKQQAQDKDNIVHIKITALRWSWDMKTYIQQRATEIDKVTGERIFNRKAYNELKIRLLLRKIQVVDAPVQPFDLEVAVSTEGHMELTPKSAELIWKSDPLLVSAFISQLDRVLEMGENPETINKSILEGEERLDLSSGLKRFFEAFSLPKEKIDEALEALATGPLKDYFPKSSEESVKTS